MNQKTKHSAWGSKMTSKIIHKLGFGALSLAAVFMSGNAQAIPFQWGEVQGSWDTTISYGAAWRVEERDPENVGKASLNPAVSTLPLEEQIAAPGQFSVNTDDGNLNYDQGDLISNAVVLTTEMALKWRNFGGFFRASGFYDFENNNSEELSEIAEEFVGSDVTMLDAYLYGNFTLAGNPGTVRLGRQVVSWGESTYIQGGINVINPFDVSKLRLAGAELRNAYLPVDMVWGQYQITSQLSFEALYLFEFEEINPDPVGTYFSTNDFATPGGRFVTLGFGLFPAGTPGLTIPRGRTRFPSDDGQYGFALRYFSPELNYTEFGLYYLKYHSRLPYISAITVTGLSPETGRYFVEYPEDIEVYAASFNTMVGTFAVQGELSYRPNRPYQVDDVELLFAALTPLNNFIPQPNDRFRSQLGEFGPGQYIPGFQELEMSQFQFTVTKLIGPGNPFNASQWVLLAEVGATKVWDLPPKSELRFNGPGTFLGGGPDVSDGYFRNPLTQQGGFADSFSWGYRLVSRVDYNNTFGTAWNLSPFFGYRHDVNGTTPGPGGNFIEGRKSISLGLSGNYLSHWGFKTSYTRYFGSDEFNLLHDRDFVSAVVRYSF